MHPFVLVLLAERRRVHDVILAEADGARILERALALRRGMIEEHALLADQVSTRLVREQAVAERTERVRVDGRFYGRRGAE